MIVLTSTIKLFPKFPFNAIIYKCKCSAYACLCILYERSLTEFVYFDSPLFFHWWFQNIKRVNQVYTNIFINPVHTLYLHSDITAYSIHTESPSNFKYLKY